MGDFRGGEIGPGPPTGGQVDVLIVDDHRSFGEALRIAIEMEPDLSCVGVASSADEALERLGQITSDPVILMDVMLPGMDGIEAIRRVREIRPGARVVILTARSDPQVVVRAAEAGASAFIPKEGGIAEILRAVRVASESEMLIDRRSLSQLLAHTDNRRASSTNGQGSRTNGQAASSDPRRPPAHPLTTRELEVLAMMGNGRDPRAIARALDISIHTARGHVKSILAKLGAHTQLEAVVIATRLGILSGV